MTRFLTCTAVTLFLGLAPALAADIAVVPGAADTSSGAAQQSSGHPGSTSEMDNDAVKSGEATMPAEGTADTLSGAAQQSSAPPSSAAANPSKPNPNSSTQ